jgi:type IV pilus assembly protein PilV
MTTLSPLKINGFTLVEVMVTMVIMSVGLLGMAGLQITGLKSTSGAGNRTSAAILVSDLAERMRGNTTAVDNNVFLDVDSSDDIDYCAAYHNGTIAVAAVSCTPAQLAAFDLNAWFCGASSNSNRASGVDDLLPQPTATIACTDLDGGVDADDCSPNSLHVLTLNWTELNPNQGSSDQTASTQSLVLTIQP